VKGTYATISANNRFVSYISDESNIVINDTNEMFDVFVYDRQLLTTKRASVASNGAQSNNHSGFLPNGYLDPGTPVMSADGRYIAFASIASNLDNTGTGTCTEPNGYSHNCSNVYLHDNIEGYTVKISVSNDGSNGNKDSAIPLMTNDGNQILFLSNSDNLVENDTNEAFDIFVRDITLVPDTVPPVVMGNPDRQPNANGWYNTNVNIDWVAADPDPYSSGVPTDPANTIASAEGVNITYTSGQSCDPAGNCATGSLQLSIDKTLPSGDFTGNPVAVRALNQTIQGTASDALSGVAEVHLSIGSTTLTSQMGGGLTMSCNATSTSCTWSANSSLLPTGVNTYSLRTIDRAGNQVLTTKQYTVI
jgi:hypothetical protein